MKTIPETKPQNSNNRGQNTEFREKIWQEGESGNPNGRPKGQKNYSTLRREAIIEVAKLNGKTPEEIEIMLHSKGLSEALKGNYQFYKDDLDRTHGTAQNNLNLSGEITSKIISVDE